MARFVPRTAAKSERLTLNGPPLELRFRPEALDIITLAFHAKPVRTSGAGAAAATDPGDRLPQLTVELFRPQESGQIPLRSCPSGYYAVMQPGDEQRTGDWICRLYLDGGNFEQADAELQVGYPSARPLRVYTFNFNELTATLRSVLEGMSPKLSLASGRTLAYQDGGLSAGPLEPGQSLQHLFRPESVCARTGTGVGIIDAHSTDGTEARGRLQDGETLTLRFRPAEPGTSVFASVGVGRPGHGGGGPPGDDDPPGPGEMDSSRLVELFLPGESTPRQSWFHELPEPVTFDVVASRADLNAPGDWRLVLTNTSGGPGSFQVGRYTWQRRYVLGIGCGGFVPHRPHPGPPSEGGGEDDSEPLSRRLELWPAGARAPVHTWNLGYQMLDYLSFELLDEWLESPGDWSLRVTNTDAVSGTFNTGVTELRGASTLVINKVHSNQVETHYITLPSLKPATVNHIRTLDVRQALHLRFSNDPPRSPIFQDHFPLGFIEAELSTGHIRDAITVDLGPLGSPDIDVRNLWLRLRVGFAIREGTLDLGDVTVSADIDIDAGLIGAACDLILGALRLFTGLPGSLDQLLSAAAESLLPRALKDLLRGQIGPVVTQLLPTGAKVLDAEADGEQLRLYVWHPADKPDEVPTGRVVVPASPGLANIEHIVVVLMENRSFDHMLGYLRQRGFPLRGLRGDESNTLSLSPEEAGPYADQIGQSFPVTRHDSPHSVVDPNHSGRSTALQLAHGNGGFVNEFVLRAIREGETSESPGWIMGYHDEEHLPVYDWLAHQYKVCDAWHASLPGPTQTNRLYAFAGSSGGNLENKPGVPMFDIRTVFDQLDEDGIDWRFYYHNVPSIALVRGFAARHDKVFHYDGVSGDAGDPGFRQRAALDQLPALTFIDPDLLGPPTPNHHNDDHPPGDVRCGQTFVAKVYNDLQAAGILDKTLLIVTYDEHGGFFDHVSPPDRAPDDFPETAKYGVRVPAFLISGRVANGVDSVLHCHASIVKTILQCFCRDESNSSIPNMGRRVTYATDLGPALMSEGTRPTPPIPSSRIPTECVPPGEDPNKVIPADDWRAWVAAAERPNPSTLPMPLAGLDLPWLAADRGAPATMQRLVKERWPITLLRVSLFGDSSCLAEDRRLELFEGGAVSPAFLANLAAIVDAAAAMSPPARVQLALFEREVIELAERFPAGAPEALRPPTDGNRYARVQDWFQDLEGPRREAQAALVRAVAGALRDRPNLLWELCGSLYIGGQAAEPEDNAGLARWLGRMRAELRGVLGSGAFIGTGTGSWTEHPHSARSNEAVLLGGLGDIPGLHPDFCSFEASQWVRGSQPAQSVRDALARARSYQEGAPLVCRDAGLELEKHPELADLAHRAGVALRNGAGFLTRVAAPEQLGEAQRLALRKAVDSLTEPRRPYLVIYDLEKEGREQYRDLHAAIRAYDDATHLERSGWLIRSEKSLAEITSDLLRLIDEDDTLVVLPLDGVSLDGKAPEGPLLRWLSGNLGVKLRP